MPASDSGNHELRSVEMGQKLMNLPLYADHLLPLLDEPENCLSRVDPKLSKSMQNALSVLMKALVAKHLFGHSNEDVKVAVASCICELTRITAPDTPYDDHRMKEVFKLIVSSLKDLSHKSSRSYVKRTYVLRNVAMLRLCLVMLDLDCDALIIEMFQHFVNAMRDYHLKNVFFYMEMIMDHVLKESENISMELLFPIFLIVKKDNKEVLPVARKLVERVLASYTSKLKPCLMQAVKNSCIFPCYYSKVVASICQETSDAVEQNDAANNDKKEDKEIRKQSASTKQVDLANYKSPKLVASDVVMQIREADSNSLKKSEHDHLADMPINVDSLSIAGADDLGTEKVVNSEFESDAYNRLTKSNLESTEPSENLYIFEKEVETVPDQKKDSKDLPGSLDEDLFMDGTVSLQNLKWTDPSNHKKGSKDASGASHEHLPVNGAVSLQNEKETGIQPTLESTEPSENIYIYEKEVETLLDHEKDSKDGPDSLHEDLSINEAVSLQNDEDTVIQPPSPKANEDEVTGLTFSILSGIVPDAQPRRKDSIIKEITPVVDNALRKASEGTSDSEAKGNKCPKEQVSATVSKDDKNPAEIEEIEKENDTATASKATSLKQSLKKLGASSKMDGLSSKQLELKKKRAQVECISERMEQNLQPGMATRGQISASQDKVQPADPTNLHGSVVKRPVNFDLVFHVNDGQPKKRKYVASRASAREKRISYNAAEKKQNTLDEMSSGFKFTTQRESSNETTLYQKCLEELQDMEGLDDAEFAKAVNFLKDDKNAIAFTTIKGPRRLVWLRSLWQAF